MKKIIFSIFLITLVLIISGCGQKDIEIDPTTPTSTPVVTKQPVKADDPANIFCKSQGHDLIIRFDQETQSSKSFCRFSDLTECTANDFYTGDCSPGESTLPEQTGSEEDINIFTACGTEYEPICGQDGLTYTNNCLAQIQGIIISYEGACVGGETTLAPISGTKKENSTSKTEQAESFSDLPPTVDTSIPSWMGVVKDFVLSSSVKSPRAFIEKCNYGGTIYYFQSDGCADCFSILYNEDGNSICYPTNNINNECPGSFSNKNRPGCTRIWTDSR